MFFFEDFTAPTTPLATSHTVSVFAIAGMPDLHILGDNLGSDAAALNVCMRVKFNSSTDAFYSWVQNESFGSSGGSAAPFSQTRGGGGDEPASVVGLIPAATALVGSRGTCHVVIPRFADAVYRTFTSESAGQTSVTQMVRTSAAGTWVAGRVDGTSTWSRIGYAASPSGMSDGRLDSVTGLYYDNAIHTTDHDPAWWRCVSTGGSNTPVAVSSVTVLLDLGNIAPGSHFRFGAE